jgi:hypothetical protein
MDQMPHVTIWLVTKNSNGHHGSCTQLVACATFIKYMDGWNMNPCHIYCPHTYCHMQLHVMCNLSYAIIGSNNCMCRMQLKINCIWQLQMTKKLLAIEKKFDSNFELCWSMGYNIHSKRYYHPPRSKKLCVKWAAFLWPLELSVKSCD